MASYQPIGRLFGNLYSTQRDMFAMDRESYDDWQARRAREVR